MRLIGATGADRFLNAGVMDLGRFAAVTQLWRRQIELKSSNSNSRSLIAAAQAS